MVPEEPKAPSIKSLCSLDGSQLSCKDTHNYSIVDDLDQSLVDMSTLEFL